MVEGALTPHRRDCLASKLLVPRDFPLKTTQHGGWHGGCSIACIVIFVRSLQRDQSELFADGQQVTVSRGSPMQGTAGSTLLSVALLLSEARSLAIHCAGHVGAEHGPERERKS